MELKFLCTFGSGLAFAATRAGGTWSSCRRITHSLVRRISRFIVTSVLPLGPGLPSGPAGPGGPAGPAGPGLPGAPDFPEGPGPPGGP